jgi:hypothetical protein
MSIAIVSPAKCCFEGINRRAFFMAGEFYDVYSMALLR